MRLKSKQNKSTDRPKFTSWQTLFFKFVSNTSLQSRKLNWQFSVITHLFLFFQMNYVMRNNLIRDSRSEVFLQSSASFAILTGQRSPKIYLCVCRPLLPPEILLVDFVYHTNNSSARKGVEYKSKKQKYVNLPCSKNGGHHDRRKEEFEHTKWVIKIRKSKQRQHNRI